MDSILKTIQDARTSLYHLENEVPSIKASPHYENLKRDLTTIEAQAKTTKEVFETLRIQPHVQL
jgi:archaellum component FlaC